MRRTLLKTLYKLAFTLIVIFSVCEVTSQHAIEYKQANTVVAAQNSNNKPQYIPPNLNYADVIKDIKQQEGVAEIVEEEPQPEKTASAEQEVDETKGVSPDKYLGLAMEHVKEAMMITDEAEKRTAVLKAFKLYKEYLKYYPGNLEGLLGAGSMAIFLGKEEDAKNILMEAYATYPKNPRVHKALGDYSFKFANFNNAIDYYNLSLSSGNLKDYATNLATAVCYEKLGDIEKAKTYYNVALYLNPKSQLAKQRIEMYQIMEQDGYQADTRKYEDSQKIPEEEDMELQDLIFDASQIK